MTPTVKEALFTNPEEQKLYEHCTNVLTPEAAQKFVQFFADIQVTQVTSGQNKYYGLGMQEYLFPHMLAFKDATPTYSVAKLSFTPTHHRFDITRNGIELTYDDLEELSLILRQPQNFNNARTQSEQQYISYTSFLNTLVHLSCDKTENGLRVNRNRWAVIRQLIYLANGLYTPSYNYNSLLTANVRFTDISEHFLHMSLGLTVEDKLGCGLKPRPGDYDRLISIYWDN